MSRPIVITGGGTGGHVFPMVAIAEALETLDVSARDIVFIGSTRGQEATLLASRAERLILLSGRGIQRSMAPRALWENVLASVGLACAIGRAVYFMIRSRPRAVVSLGGYGALAADVAAVLTRRALVLVDFDAVPGATHRLVRQFATRLCTSFASTDPRAIETGAPLRDAIMSVDRSDTAVARASRGERREQRWCIVVMTGSLGAQRVNSAIMELAALWRDRDDVSLLHVTGQRDYARCRETWHARTNDAIEYRQEAFASMSELWARADLAICRAGAITIAELTYLAIPSILIPLPGAPSDHQSANARAVATAGGAVVLRDGEVNATALAAEVDALLDRETLREMGIAAGSLRHENAAAQIATSVLRDAR